MSSIGREFSPRQSNFEIDCNINKSEKIIDEIGGCIYQAVSA